MWKQAEEINRMKQNTKQVREYGSVCDARVKIKVLSHRGKAKATSSSIAIKWVQRLIRI